MVLANGMSHTLSPSSTFFSQELGCCVSLFFRILLKEQVLLYLFMALMGSTYDLSSSLFTHKRCVSKPS